MKEDLENEKDDQIVELFRQGKTYRQIGDDLGFPISIISSKIQKLKKVGIINDDIISQRKSNIAYLKQKKSSETNEQIIKLLEQGKTISEIAHVCKLPKTYIYQKIKILQETGKLSQDIIEQNPNLAYLKKQTINNDELIELFKQGKTHKEISKALGCALSTTSQYIQILKDNGVITDDIINERKYNLAIIYKQLIELFRQGKTYRQIGDELGFNRTVISSKIQKLKEAGIIDDDIISQRNSNIAYLKQKKLSETNEQIIKLLEQGKTIPEIVRTLKLTPSTIQRKIKVLQETGKLNQEIINKNPNLSYLKNKKVTINNDELIELFRQGKTHKEISNALGYTLPAISQYIQILKDNGVITNDIINERKSNLAIIYSQLIELFKQGKTYKQIGDELGFDRITISQYIQELKIYGVITNDIINERKTIITYLPKEKLSGIDNQIIKLLKQGNTIREISKILKITTTLIFRRIRILQKAGKLSQDIIKSNPDLAYLNKKKVTINDAIIELFKQGKTPKEISMALGYAPVTISRRIQKLKNKGIIIDEQNSNLMATYKQLIELFRQGKTQKEISEALGCSPSTISKLIQKFKKVGVIDDDIISERKYNILYLKKEKSTKIDSQIIELLKQGKTIAEIADELFYSKFTISKKIRNLKISGILDSKEKHSNNKTDKTPLSKHIQNMQKAKSIYYLNSKYGHNFFSKAFRQARAINDLGKLTQEDVDILAKALLIEPPTLENVINISRLYIDTKQYQKCIMFLKQSREFFNEEQKSKINELLLEIKTTIKNNQKKQNRNRQIERN